MVAFVAVWVFYLLAEYLSKGNHIHIGVNFAGTHSCGARRTFASSNNFVHGVVSEWYAFVVDELFPWEFTLS